jgi:enterochelin esterase-like enzyme
MKKIYQIIILLLLCTPSIFAQEYERYKKIADTTITSKYLGFDKNITITVPFEWQEDLDRDFPLIIVFDRQNRRSHNYILNTIDYLTSNEQMPSSIIISVGSEKNRFIETWHKESGENGLALENEKFIFDELIPLAEEKYNASSFRLFVGHSRYGYFTSSLFHSRINDLNAVVSLSPFFEQDNVDLTDSIAQLANQTFTSTKYYRYGIGNDYPDDFYKMDSTLKKLNNTNINSKGFLFKEAAHNVTPGLAISMALYEIFEDWSEIQSKYFSNEQLDLEIINSLEEEIITNYGSRLELSIGVLN